MKKKIMAAALAVCMMATLVAGMTLAYFTDTDSKTNTFTTGNVGLSLTEDKWDAANDNKLMPGKKLVKDPTIVMDRDSEDAWLFLSVDVTKYVSLGNLMGIDAHYDQTDDIDWQGHEVTYVENGKNTVNEGFTAFATKLFSDNQFREKVLDKWFTGIDHSKWKIMNVDEIKAALSAIANKQNPTHLVVVLGYQVGTVKGGDEIPFMTHFGVPGTVTQEMMKENGKLFYNSSIDKNLTMTFTAYAIQAQGLTDLDTAYKAIKTDYPSMATSYTPGA